MYKTVRKGDASLQYTILPQTDAPVSSQESPIKMTKYTVFILFFIFVSTVALINRTFFSHTYMELQKKIILTSITEQASEIRVKNHHEYKETKIYVPKPTKFSQAIADRRGETSTFSTIILDKVDDSAVNTETSFTLNNTQRNPSTMPKQILSSESAPIETVSFPSTTVPPSTVTPKKTRCRVTETPREHETVEQPHMKSVAKAGWRRTPDPIMQKLMNTLMAKATQPIKRSYTDIGIIVLALLLVIVAILYVCPCSPRRSKKKIKQPDVEEPETDKLEGDKLTLLKAYTDENE